MKKRKFAGLLTPLLYLACALGVAAAAPVPCPRFQAGSTLTAPADLFSSHGVLEVRMSYRGRIDESGNQLYCFMTAAGDESPTLHVHPGDHLLIHLKNELPPGGVVNMPNMPEMSLTPSADTCGTSIMTSTSVNLHYHGTNVPPACHQDEVIKTAVDGGKSFDYDLHFPKDEPPGLYWYHPHIHGMSEATVQGGASGALIVEGLEKFNPAVVGLPQQLLIVRDSLIPGYSDSEDPDVPSWDLSVNYTPVPFPNYTPAVLRMRPNDRQLWRVLNACGDCILDLQLEYDGVSQPLDIVALDGVPTGSQDGEFRGHSIRKKHILIPPAGRAEFIITGPSNSVGSAILKTRNVETGPDGDLDLERPLVRIETSHNAVRPAVMPAATNSEKNLARFGHLREAKPTAHRKLYFSESPVDPNDPDSDTNFYITVDGASEALFNPDNPPAIETTHGAVEDWTIENRTLENHEFHIHQIHFLELGRNGKEVPDGQFLDTIQIPYWSGTGPYPSVKLRMDFRGETVGDFVYHCHILEHEDKGMMAIIRVHPK